MTIEILAALSLFALVSSITPGPNNMMLLASGANYGLLRSLPHMLGVAIGFSLMLVIVGFGIMQLFELYPTSYTLLQVVSISYLLYLAFKLATAAPMSTDTAKSGRPMTFIQAVLFQWVNPKAWTMAVTAISIYAPNQDTRAILLVALVFGVVNLPAIFTWLMMGKQMQRLLTKQKHLKVFNVSMALLLVGSLYPMLG
ncbi:LysE family translocator [Corallincola platygyrae]|uniref:LysE family translocator n=1 Tax=Corallincola platygyrae TaxID=1193278 RepID=A0ABW4XRD5_9GAMM